MPFPASPAPSRWPCTARRVPTCARWQPTWDAPWPAARTCALRRTAVGSFTLDEAVPLEGLGPESLLSPADAVRDLAGVTVDEATAVSVSYGKVLPLAELGVADLGDGPWAVKGADGSLLAVYESHRDDALAKPAVVVAPAGSTSR